MLRKDFFKVSKEEKRKEEKRRILKNLSNFKVSKKEKRKEEKRIILKNLSNFKISKEEREKRKRGKEKNLKIHQVFSEKEEIQKVYFQKKKMRFSKFLEILFSFKINFKILGDSFFLSR